MGGAMKVLIFDSQGAEISDKYRSMFPNIRFRGIEPPGLPAVYHPHGAMCGYFICSALAARPGGAEVVFARIFNDKAQMYGNANTWMIDVVEQERPDYISNSWGLWDQDDQLGILVAKTFSEGYVKVWKEMKARIGFVDFRASGNNDSNDSDQDVAYPQAMMPDDVHLIGACDRAGIPTPWSSDGRGVECVFWGHQIRACDIEGRFSVVSGTSFACPKACGVAARLGLGDREWRDLVIAQATRPAGEAFPLPHAKWGWGCMEESWQRFARESKAYRPALEWLAGATLKAEWHDFNLVG
jgi:hypothetical protein